jgi:hypothetical protein
MLRNDKFTSSFRAKKIMINDVLKYSSSTALQYLYNIYKRQVFKPFSKCFFLKKKYEVIYIENKKKFKSSTK